MFVSFVGLMGLQLFCFVLGAVANVLKMQFCLGLEGLG